MWEFIKLTYLYGAVLNFIGWPCYGIYCKYFSKKESDKKHAGIMWTGSLLTPFWPLYIYVWFWPPKKRNHPTNK